MGAERWGPGVSIRRYEFGSWRGLVVSREELVLAHFWGDDPEVLLGRAAKPLEPRLHALLNDYFSGRATEPAGWAVGLEGLPQFDRAVYRAVRAVPRGLTATYKEIAVAAGSPRAARAVGNALARNPIPLFVPCHRVRGANGAGGWSGPPGWKDRLLALEARPG